MDLMMAREQFTPVV